MFQGHHHQEICSNPDLLVFLEEMGSLDQKVIADSQANLAPQVHLDSLAPQV